jgi:hypothetical protein
MKAEFTEKPYEKYFSQELSGICGPTFSPDQVSENYLGFDEAFFVKHLMRFPHIIPFRNTRRRRWLVGISSEEIKHVAKELNHLLPRFRFNLFVQYKRPDYLRARNAKYWRDWKQPYYRYDITENQQTRLQSIHEAAQRRAVVVYAAPAIWSGEEFFERAADRRIIENSNIAQVTRIGEHKKYTYARPGNFGVAYSEPEEIESESLESLISAGSENQALSFTAHVKLLAEKIEESMSKNLRGKKVLEEAKRAVIGESLQEVLPEIEGSFLEAIIALIAYSDCFGTNIYLVADQTHSEYWE